MRKILILPIMLSMLFLLISCNDDPRNKNDIEKKSDTGIVLFSGSDSLNGSSSKIMSSDISDAQSKNGGIIAKSNNAITDKQKREILESLEKELDSLLHDIDSMDEVSDSELDVEGLN